MKAFYSAMFLLNNVKVYNIIKKSILVILGSAIIGVSSHIYIPTLPVPFTMQSLTVMLIASTLGSRLAVYTVLLYIAEAFIGLPVTTIKAVGMDLFMAPSFGYVIGYIFMAYIIGLMKDKGADKSIISSTLYILFANQLMFVFGVAFLSYFLGSVQKGILLGYVPFVLFDLIKVSIVVLSVSVMNRFRSNI